MKKQTKKTYTIYQLFYNLKSCSGWAVKLENAKNKYIYHNSNDLGLLGELPNIPRKDFDKFELIEKIKIDKHFFIYVLKPMEKGCYTIKNMLNSGEEIADKETLTREIKSCWNL